MSKRPEPAPLDGRHEALEDTIYDSQSMRDFLGIDLSQQDVPDATTLLKFRRLLEVHHLTEKMFAQINDHLSDAACC